MERRVMAYVGLGANVGPARETLARAALLLGSLPGVGEVAVSPLYRTAPVGPVDQDDFLNAVVGLDVPEGRTPADGAVALRVTLKALERAIGRIERERWGPREIDLDLLLFGDHRLRVERDDAARSADPSRTGVQWLEVPHPEARQRLFVLAPLADLAPDLRPPGWDVTVARQRDGVRQDELGAARALATWDAYGLTWRDDPSLMQS